MKKIILITTIMLIVFSFISCSNMNSVPSFIKVGKQYKLEPYMGGYFVFNVLEIGKDGWIKYQSREREGWINTAAAIIITEIQ